MSAPARTVRMSDFITVNLEQRIRRPVDVVRSQFFDMPHHIRSGVHQGIRLTLLHAGADECRVASEFRVLGMKQRDEQRLVRRADGTMVQEFTSGMNAGGSIEFVFRADGADATVVQATARLPRVGVKRLLAPLFKAALIRLGKKSLEEDRRDLEDRNYQPG